MYARVRLPSFVFPVQPRCLLSLVAHSSAAMCMPCSIRRIVAENVNNGAIMAYAAWKKWKTVEKERYCTKNTIYLDMYLDTIAIIVMPLTAIIHCLWKQQSIMTMTTSVAMYIIFFSSCTTDFTTRFVDRAVANNIFKIKYVKREVRHLKFWDFNY